MNFTIADLERVMSQAAPWFTMLTGGLAGAALTFWLNQRAARRGLPRVSIATQVVDYSLQDQNSEDVKLSYRGRLVDGLFRYNLSIENCSKRTIQSASLLLVLGKGAEVFSSCSETHPINQRIELVPVANTPGAFKWELGELRPTDRANLQILLSKLEAPTVHWRGDDYAEVTFDGKLSGASAEAEIRSLIFLAAVFISLGAISQLTSLLRGILLIALAPQITKFALRWLNFLTRREDQAALTTIEIGTLSGEGNTIIGAQYEKTSSLL